jgi:Phosphorylated CTD interacting factor 1 WW domain
VPAVMLKMAHPIHALLKAADTADTTSSSTNSDGVGGEALCFVVIVPAWEGTKAWCALKDSSFMRRHVLLEQREHGYCEGRQQMRRTRYRLASAPTSVFFMQTRAAAARSVLRYATYTICERVSFQRLRLMRTQSEQLRQVSDASALVMV